MSMTNYLGNPAQYRSQAAQQFRDIQTANRYRPRGVSTRGSAARFGGSQIPTRHLQSRRPRPQRYSSYSAPQQAFSPHARPLRHPPQSSPGIKYGPPPTPPQAQPQIQPGWSGPSIGGPRVPEQAQPPMRPGHGPPMRPGQGIQRPGAGGFQLPPDLMRLVQQLLGRI
jgi:hypothetical protein